MTPADVQVLDDAGGAMVLFTQQQEAFLTKLAEVGVDKDALAAAGIDRKILRAWKTDREFAAAAEEAARDYTDKMIRLGYEAVEKAAPDDLLNHPNLFMFSVKQRDNSFRDSVTIINDNRRQTVNILSEQEAERLARALANVTDGELA